jgi:hypothetical protein
VLILGLYLAYSAASMVAGDVENPSEMNSGRYENRRDE